MMPGSHNRCHRGCDHMVVTISAYHH